MVDQSQICIIDPAHHVPGLTLIFPEADYFVHERDQEFNYVNTRQMSRDEFQKVYGFNYKADWNEITSQKYKLVLLVFPLLDGMADSGCSNPQGISMLNKLYSILNSNQFQMVALFDVHDYDYDPTELTRGKGIHIYFKRNYNTRRIYDSSVVPFPYCMFVTPCILWSLVKFPRPIFEAQHKIPKVMWCGSLYTHDDKKCQVFRDRKNIHQNIKHMIETISFIPTHDFVNQLSKYALCLDLQGVGDPNKRTFEIFRSGSLWITNIVDLEWGFDAGDRFPDECIFGSAEDFVRKKNRLLTDASLYSTTLMKQQILYQKYMNREWITKYLYRFLKL